MRSFDRDSFFKCPSPFRVNDELRHNPYVGSFHGVSRVTDEMKNKSLAKHNPHLGIIRHSPASTIPTKSPVNLGFKGLLYDDGNWRSSVLSQVQIACGQRDSKLHVNQGVLNSLPTTLFTLPLFSQCMGNHTNQINGQHETDMMCAICLDGYTDGCEIRNLACGHCFHRRCADIWLSGQHSDESMKTAICPCCRQDAVFMTPISEQSITPLLDESDATEGQQVSLSPTRGIVDLSSPAIFLPQQEYTDDRSDDTSKEIDEVINGILEGTGVVSSSLLNIDNHESVLHVGDMTDCGIHNDTISSEEIEELSHEIPRSAFANVGRYLFGFLSGGHAVDVIDTSMPMNQEDFASNTISNISESVAHDEGDECDDNSEDYVIISPTSPVMDVVHSSK